MTTSRSARIMYSLAVPMALWLILLATRPLLSVLPECSFDLIWLAQIVCCGILLFFYPGLFFTSWIPNLRSSWPVLEKLLLAPIINMFFLMVLGTIIKAIFGELQYLPLVAAWLACTVMVAGISTLREARITSNQSWPTGLTTQLLVVTFVSAAIIWASPSRGVDEEHWFCDKYVDSDQFRKASYPAPSDDLNSPSLRPTNGAAIISRNVYSLISGPAEFEIQNRNPQDLVLALRLIVHSEFSTPIRMTLNLNEEEIGSFWLQERFNRLRHGYGYPSPNLLIDERVTVPSGRNTLGIQIIAEGDDNSPDNRIVLYDYSNMSLSEFRRHFHKNFAYGDTADVREMLNAARDLTGHLFPYQRFYVDDVGVPGVNIPVEEQTGGPYWSNFILHPFLGNIALVLVEDSMRTFTALALFEAILLFAVLLAAFHLIGWELDSKALIPLALLVFSYFCFVRPGLEANSRQALHDILLIISIVHLLRGFTGRFLASASLLLLTTYSGFGLLVGLLGFRILLGPHRPLAGKCLALVIVFQVVLNLFITWMFIRAGQEEFWSHLQSEWLNRYYWIVDQILGRDFATIEFRLMNMARVAAWMLLGTFLLPLVQLVRQNRNQFLVFLTMLFYTATILLMIKPRAHYISSLIVLAALGGLPVFASLAWNRRRWLLIVWMSCASTAALFCYYHSLLYIYTEDFLPPLFPPLSAMERLLWPF